MQGRLGALGCCAYLALALATAAPLPARAETLSPASPAAAAPAAALPPPPQAVSPERSEPESVGNWTLEHFKLGGQGNALCVVTRSVGEDHFGFIVGRAGFGLLYGADALDLPEGTQAELAFSVDGGPAIPLGAAAYDQHTLASEPLPPPNGDKLLAIFAHGRDAEFSASGLNAASAKLSLSGASAAIDKLRLCATRNDIAPPALVAQAPEPSVAAPPPAMAAVPQPLPGPAPTNAPPPPPLRATELGSVAPQPASPPAGLLPDAFSRLPVEPAPSREPPFAAALGGPLVASSLAADDFPAAAGPVPERVAPAAPAAAQPSVPPAPQPATAMVAPAPAAMISAAPAVEPAPPREPPAAGQATPVAALPVPAAAPQPTRQGGMTAPIPVPAQVDTMVRQTIADVAREKRAKVGAAVVLPKDINGDGHADVVLVFTLLEGAVNRGYTTVLLAEGGSFRRLNLVSLGGQPTHDPPIFTGRSYIVSADLGTGAPIDVEVELAADKLRRRR